MAMDTSLGSTMDRAMGAWSLGGFDAGLVLMGVGVVVLCDLHGLAQRVREGGGFLHADALRQQEILVPDLQHQSRRTGRGRPVRRGQRVGVDPAFNQGGHEGAFLGEAVG